MISDPSAQQPILNSGSAIVQVKQELFNSMKQNLSESSFPIVGIAASAGGLEAFKQFLSYLPNNTGMAFMLILHLSPDYESRLSQILARAIQLPASSVKSGMAVEPNQIYVIPPNTKMILNRGMLQRSPREKVLGKYMLGDAFFNSLA